MRKLLLNGLNTSRNLTTNKFLSNVTYAVFESGLNVKVCMKGVDKELLPALLQEVRFHLPFPALKKYITSGVPLPQYLVKD